MMLSSDSRYIRKRKAAKILAILRDFLGDDLSGKSCLDIGCGDGIITKKLGEDFCFTAGTDIEIISLRAAELRSAWRSNLNGQRGGLLHAVRNYNQKAILNKQISTSEMPTFFIQANGKELPFQKDHFDVIVLAQVYEHVDNPANLINEIQRVLKPSGIVFFSGPNRWAVIEEHYNLPLLSWLPKMFANLYMRLTKRGIAYDICPLSFWQLKDLLRNFEIHDYAPKLLQNPKQFYVEELVMFRVPLWVGKLLLPWVPNFNWVLTNKDPKGLKIFPKLAKDSNTLELGYTEISDEILRVSAIEQDAYTQEYYLAACEGHKEFITTQGRNLPQRLSRPLELAHIQPGQFILDIGCGRGEITLHCAQKKAFTWGLDYAPEALQLTKRLPNSREMAFQQANALYLPFAENSIDTIFMLDIVEHLTPEGLVASLNEVHRILKPSGKLIVHTMPNLWYYRFGYPLFRLIQQLRGQESPKDPRSRWRYAHLHVNEQNPLKLKNTLSAVNFHTKVWLESTQDYTRESNKIIRVIMQTLSRLPVLKWIFCNDIFAISIKNENCH
ncbi:MAG: methyltransferase domain-containing protein [Chloroflexi bacterium]|nr:methyltransferase domain-containing protein [Chloroflexota bacterium]